MRHRGFVHAKFASPFCTSSRSSALDQLSKRVGIGARATLLLGIKRTPRSSPSVRLFRERLRYGVVKIDGASCDEKVSSPSPESSAPRSESIIHRRPSFVEGLFGGDDDRLCGFGKHERDTTRIRRHRKLPPIARSSRGHFRTVRVGLSAQRLPHDSDAAGP